MGQKAAELIIFQPEFHVFKCETQSFGRAIQLRLMMYSGMVKDLIIVPMIIQIVPDFFERVPQN